MSRIIQCSICKTGAIKDGIHIIDGWRDETGCPGEASDTLRDKFAMAALQGIIASAEWAGGLSSRNDIAEFSFKYADAMLKARSLTPDINE